MRIILTNNLKNFEIFSKNTGKEKISSYHAFEMKPKKDTRKSRIRNPEWQ